MDAISTNIAVAVASALITFFITNYFKKSGKITIHITNRHIGLTKSNGQGGQEPTRFVDEAEELNINLGLDIYNSSETPKSLREIEIQLISLYGRKLIMPAYVLNLTKDGPERDHIFKSINLPPREITHIDLQIWDSYLNPANYTSIISIYLKAKYPNGSKFRARLDRITLARSMFVFILQRE